MMLQWNFGLLPYGELWRRKRKLMHAHFHPGVADRYHSVQLASVRRFAQNILVTKNEKEDLLPVVRLSFAQMFFKAVYGIDVDSYKSEYISLPEQLAKNVDKAITPGRFIVDVLPICAWHVHHDVVKSANRMPSKACSRMVPRSKFPATSFGESKSPASRVGQSDKNSPDTDGSFLSILDLRETSFISIEG
jgi:hypothetical protein